MYSDDATGDPPVVSFLKGGKSEDGLLQYCRKKTGYERRKRKFPPFGQAVCTCLIFIKNTEYNKKQEETMRHKTKTKVKCWLVMVLCLSMIFPSAATFVSAAEEPAYTDGLCEHHTEHTGDCGYVEGVESQPCIYKTEGCSECRQATTIPNTDIQENISVGQLIYTLRSDATAVVTDGKKDSSGYITIPAQIQVDGEMYTVTEVAEKAFYDYSGAKGITLPETLRVIGAKAFEGAAVYTKGVTLTIPDSVTEIGEGAFAQNDFGKIIIGEGLTEIPSGAFEGISFLTDDVELILGSQITTIAADAFDGGTVTKVTVKGETGSLDAVLKQVAGLKKAEIVYDDPNAQTSAWLQEQIDAAKDGVPQTIEISMPLTITETVTVPAGKDIVLIDDGQSHTLYSKTEQMFEVQGRLTIDSTAESNRLIFKGGTTKANSRGNIVKISGGGELLLKDAVFCDGILAKSFYSGAVLVGANSRFEMTGGTIENFTLNSQMLTGAVCVTSGGNFQMSGGIIQNNSNTYSGSYYSGGGVLLYAWNAAEKDAVMTLSGNAVIRNNTSSDGGGVYLIGNTDFKMTGGLITNNEAYGYGGGVCVAGTGGSVGAGGATANETKFTMEGGEISDNHAYNSGGGIYINSDDVVLKGGKIENNIAENHGGGIYVSEPPQEVKIYNAIVTENDASVMGGGLWFCPTGDAVLTVTNGIAVYKNKADGAGDDFVALNGNQGIVTLADRFLGGGSVEWYSDGGVIGGIGGGITPPQNVTGSVDSTVSRFDPDDPGERLTGISGSGNYALKAIVSDNTIKLAESQAKLWITGNRARRGGGIGSNGAALLGEQNRDYTLQVTKSWSENTPENEKKEILVLLKIGEYELDSVRLNAANNWTADFTQLPDPESLEGNLQYAAVESPVPPNFTPTYQDAVIDGNKIYINITNNYVPEYTSVKVTKEWEDNNDQDGIRPESITVKLLANGEDTGETCVLSAENNWTDTFTGLDKYKDGKEIVYTLEEVSVNGYHGVITGDASAGFVITNSHTPATTEISGSKTWDDANDQDGKRPESITIRLYANGEQVEAVNVTAENGWKWSFTNLPKYADGEAIIYTIAEDAVPDYSAKVDGFNVTNSYTPGRTSVTVTKAWSDADNQDGLRPGEITVKLLADGKDTGKTLTLSKENRWMGIFTDLDEYAGGKKVVYTIEEISVKGYDSVITGDASTGFVITNSHTPAEIELSGSKTWDDADNQDGKRPESITIRLYANGEQVEVANITAEDGWKWNFTNLPKYENGEEIRYTITEDAVSGYQSEVEGMDVTNHYTPGQIHIPVTKNWKDQDDADGIRPDSITVKLYADGKDTGKELVLNQENNWTGIFNDLDEYAGGEKIVYTIEEVAVKGYASVITGNASTGFVITNSHTPGTPETTDTPDTPGTPEDDTPQTGDTTNLALWVAFLAISGTGLTATLILGKRKRYCRKHMK